MTVNESDSISARLARARTAINSGQWKEAEKVCQLILSEHPDHPQAGYVLAFIFQHSGQPGRAIETYRRLIARHGANADLLNDLGITHESVAQTENALNCYRRAIDHNPSHVSALYNLGRLQRTTGNPGEALAHLATALSLSQGSAPVLLELGMAHNALGNHDEAIRHLQQARRIAPSSPAISNALGNAWQSQGELGQAIQCYRAAIQLKPDFAEACNNLGSACLAMGNVAEALDHYAKAVAIQPDWAGAKSNILLAKNYLSDDPATLFADHIHWAATLQNTAEPVKRSVTRKPGGRIRIGYLSPDFRMHSVAYFIDALLRNHNRTRFETVCLADVAREDSMTRELRANANAWHNIYAKSDDEVYRLIRASGIDILVDLAGHTANNRLALFARQAAPIQVSYLGYPNTTGLPTMQYRITDHWADPEGIADTLHSEKLVRLSRGFLCYTPIPDSPAAGDLPATSKGQVTFGSFNVVAKISAACIETWSEILRQLPESRLLVKSAGLQDAATRDYLLKRFAQHGIAPERVEPVARTTDFHSHMKLYQRVDIALDTFPYNGTTTTCEALWMGVPVVTLSGNRHAGRVGCSLLNQAGLADMVAASTDDYIATARTLANDLEKLRALRRTLRESLASGPLCDGPGLTRAFEEACLGMIENSQG